MNTLNPVIACWAVAITLISGLRSKHTIPTYRARVLVAFASAITVLAVFAVVLR